MMTHLQFKVISGDTSCLLKFGSWTARSVPQHYKQTNTVCKTAPKYLASAWSPLTILPEAKLSNFMIGFRWQGWATTAIVIKMCVLSEKQFLVAINSLYANWEPLPPCKTKQFVTWQQHSPVKVMTSYRPAAVLHNTVPCKLDLIKVWE